MSTASVVSEESRESFGRSRRQSMRRRRRSNTSINGSSHHSLKHTKTKTKRDYSENRHYLERVSSHSAATSSSGSDGGFGDFFRSSARDDFFQSRRQSSSKSKSSKSSKRHLLHSQPNDFDNPEEMVVTAASSTNSNSSSSSSTSNTSSSKTSSSSSNKSSNNNNKSSTPKTPEPPSDRSPVAPLVNKLDFFYSNNTTTTNTSNNNATQQEGSARSRSRSHSRRSHTSLYSSNDDSDSSDSILEQQQQDATNNNNSSSSHYSRFRNDHKSSDSSVRSGFSQQSTVAHSNHSRNRHTGSGTSNNSTRHHDPDSEGDSSIESEDGWGSTDDSTDDDDDRRSQPRRGGRRPPRAAPPTSPTARPSRDSDISESDDSDDDDDDSLPCTNRGGVNDPSHNNNGGPRYHPANAQQQRQDSASYGSQSVDTDDDDSYNDDSRSRDDDYDSRSSSDEDHDNNRNAWGRRDHNDDDTDTDDDDNHTFGNSTFGFGPDAEDHFRDEEDPHHYNADGLHRDTFLDEHDDDDDGPFRGSGNYNHDKPRRDTRGVLTLLIPCCFCLCCILVAVVLCLLFFVFFNNNNDNATAAPSTAPSGTVSQTPSAPPVTPAPTTPAPTVQPTWTSIGDTWSALDEIGFGTDNDLDDDNDENDNNNNQAVTNVQTDTSSNGVILAVSTTTQDQSSSVQFYQWVVQPNNNQYTWRAQHLEPNLTIAGTTTTTRAVSSRHLQESAPPPLRVQVSASGQYIMVSSATTVQVLEYDFDRSYWIGRGQVLPTRLGATAAMDDAGTTVIAGRAVYHWDGLTALWRQSLSKTFLLQYSEVQRVLLSPNGQVLATLGRVNETSPVVLEVWEWQSQIAWKRLGRGEFDFAGGDDDDDDNTNTTIADFALSRNGRTLAVAATRLRVFRYQPTDNYDDDGTWTLLGDPIPRACQSVSLSLDGQTVAAATAQGWARTFDYVGDLWQSGSDAIFAPGFTSVSLSGEGNVMTLGILTGGGRARVRSYNRRGRGDGDTNDDAPTAAPRQCNGLESLCGVPVNQALFAVMHLAHADEAAVTSLATHQLNLTQGLQAGMRGLHLEMGYCDVVGVEQLVFVNSLCALGRSEPRRVVTAILDFLEQNPSEVLVLQIQVNAESGGPVTTSEVYEALTTISVNDITLADYLYQHPQDVQQWPTLGELIETGQRVIVFVRSAHDDTSVCQPACPAGFNDMWKFVGENRRAFTSTEEFTNVTGSCPVVSGLDNPQFYSLNLYLETPNSAAAVKTNSDSFLTSFLGKCATTTSLIPNMLLVDFWNTGAVIEKIAAHNALLVGPTSALVTPLAPSFSPTQSPTSIQVTDWKRLSPYPFGGAVDPVIQKSVSLSQNGTVMALASSADLNVDVYRLGSGYWSRMGRIIATSDYVLATSVKTVFVADDGSKLAVADDEGISTFRWTGVYWATEGKLRIDACCTALDMSADLQTATQNGKIHSFVDGAWTTVEELTYEELVSASLDAGGKHLAVLSRIDNVASIEIVEFNDDTKTWNVSTQTGDLPSPESFEPHLVAISRDGNILAAANKLRVKIWERRRKDGAWTIQARNIRLANLGVSSISLSEGIPTRLMVRYSHQAVQVVELDTELTSSDWTDTLTVFATDEFYDTTAMSRNGQVAVLSNSPRGGSGYLQTVATGEALRSALGLPTLPPSAMPSLMPIRGDTQKGEMPVGNITKPILIDPHNPSVSKAPTSAPTAPRQCNGLESLCSLPVNQALFAVMHRAHADEAAVTSLATHQLNLTQGLQAGMRGLHLEMGYCEVDGVKQIGFVNSLCALGWSEPRRVVTAILDFLEQNPYEVLVLQIEVNAESGGPVTASEVYEALSASEVNDVSLLDYLYKRPKDVMRWPTLGKLIGTGKRVIAFVRSAEDDGGICHPEKGCPVGFHDMMKIVGETGRSYTSVEDITNTKGSCPVVSGERDPSFYSLNLYLETPSSTAAAVLNSVSFLSAYLQECISQTSLLPNMLLVDFWNTGDIIYVVSTYNSLVSER